MLYSKKLGNNSLVPYKLGLYISEFLKNPNHSKCNEQYLMQINDTGYNQIRLDSIL